MTERYFVTLEDGRQVSPPDVLIKVEDWRPEYTAVNTCGFSTLTVMSGDIPVGFIPRENLALIPSING